MIAIEREAKLCFLCKIDTIETMQFWVTTMNFYQRRAINTNSVYQERKGIKFTANCSFHLAFSIILSFS